MMAVLGGSIVVALVQRSIPEDPAEIFELALIAAEKQDATTLKAASEKLATYPEFATKKKLLDGLLHLGSSRPVKAISLLKEASEDPEIRTRSLMMLGSAYAQSEDLKRAVDTFELVLKENEDSSDARFRLATVYKEMLAFDLSLSHLDALIKGEYKPSECRRMRGEIRFDRREFAGAASDYEAAIAADKNNPMNSLVAERLIQCLLKIGDLKKTETYLSLVDQTSSKTFIEAEQLLQSGGDSAKLAAITESLQKNLTFDPRSHILYGRRMLKEGTPDKATEGLAGLKVSLQFVTRNAELFQIVAVTGSGQGILESTRCGIENAGGL
jgi:tetratricopeptide (TPR) repeat protein